MRMWMVDPKIMCRQHLIGEHGEIHKHRHVFIKGYSISGRRGQVEPTSMALRHDLLAEEMLARGYRHESAYKLPDLSYLPSEDREGRVDVSQSLLELCRRCEACRNRIRSDVVLAIGLDLLKGFG